MERDAPTGGSAADVVGAPSGDGEQRRAAGSELPPTPPANTSPAGNVSGPHRHGPEQVACCSLTLGTRVHRRSPRVGESRAPPLGPKRTSVPWSWARHRLVSGTRGRARHGPAGDCLHTETVADTAPGFLLHAECGSQRQPASLPTGCGGPHCR